MKDVHIIRTSRTGSKARVSDRFCSLEHLLCDVCPGWNWQCNSFHRPLHILQLLLVCATLKYRSMQFFPTLIGGIFSTETQVIGKVGLYPSCWSQMFFLEVYDKLSHQTLHHWYWCITWSYSLYLLSAPACENCCEACCTWMSTNTAGRTLTSLDLPYQPLVRNGGTTTVTALEVDVKLTSSGSKTLPQRLHTARCIAICFVFGTSSWFSIRFNAEESLY